MNEVSVIGAGLAGCEAAYMLANSKIPVKLYEMKPKKFSKAHKSPFFGELVCSNSFKSKNKDTASGMLKLEMQLLNSLVLKVANLTSVEAGQALAVDRNLFSRELTRNIKNCKYITIVNEEVKSIPKGYVIIATGPLTSSSLMDSIKKIINCSNLYFYDAIAPILYGESVNLNGSYGAFYSSRYAINKKDYLNCPMNKEQYNLFYESIIKAELANIHSFDKPKVYEGCMPIEVMAKRGKDTMRFGPLKPVGIKHPETNESYYAIVQLRKENLIGSFFNMVGFQTNLKYGEQKRIFRQIPALKDAEFLRYGSMHKNIFINSPALLNENLSLKGFENIYFAGQITGVEGYLESAACGMLAGYFLKNKIKGAKIAPLPQTSIMASLIRYITNKGNLSNFQPMSSNFGLLPELRQFIGNKKEKHKMLSERGVENLKEYINSNGI